jgi:hypothetical protein
VLYAKAACAPHADSARNPQAGRPFASGQALFHETEAVTMIRAHKKSLGRSASPAVGISPRAGLAANSHRESESYARIGPRRSQIRTWQMNKSPAELYNYGTHDEDPVPETWRLTAWPTWPVISANRSNHVSGRASDESG